jgi:electron transfer flavoprotein beta subunit
VVAVTPGFPKKQEELMNIIVCVKQVPDTAQIRLNPETRTLVRDGVENILNPYDAEALETALILKDKYGAKVTVITMGPPQAKDILKDAIALGADQAYLLTDRVVAGSDTLATSVALAALVKHLGDYDLILCGREAADGCTAQVGPEMAEHLGIPQVTSALKVDFVDGRFVVERETENWAETLAAPAPLLVTMTRAEKELRFASIRGKMKARKTEIPIKTAADLGIDNTNVGLNASPTRVIKVFTPEATKVDTQIIKEDDVDVAVDKLVEKLIAAGVVKR